LAKTTFAYAWLYFDQIAAGKLYEYCSTITPNWGVPQAMLDAGLGFMFGSQTSG